uniref:Inorganic phosphate transporter n=2 Tax=Alexandrium monilatum TaxID=311494 RepID=A0A7S4R7I3_9DINO|mmetsp:Transcript_103495/g.309201  ORF Transcript_103495/g.309201 Transcript_103495/m.309201 type:complete len:186 (+) Transcript_103495:180-737(+)
MALGPLTHLVPMMAMLLLQRYDLVTLGYLPHMRVLFVAVQLLSLGTLGLLYRRIKLMPSAGERIHVPALRQWGQELRPAVQQSASEYDISKLTEQLQQLVVGCCILGFIHLKWGYVLPLALQSLSTPLQLVDSPLVQIHLRGRPARGNLKRPFPMVSPFGFPMQSQAGGRSEAKEAKASKGKKGR